MLPAVQEHPILAFLRQLPIRDKARALGTLLVGTPGAGKTILESLLVLFDLLLGRPGCALDPLGTLSEAFVYRLCSLLWAFPTGEDDPLWQRLRFIPLGEDATTFPIYQVRHGESLWDASMRLITVLERASPQLATSPLTWPAARRLALNAGVLLTALSWQLDKVEDLLFNTSEWSKSGTFDEAINRNPQAKEAVSYFRNYYLPLPRSEQRRLAGTFLDQVLPLTDPTLRAIFASSSTPGIDWEEVEALGQIVILSFKAIRNPAARLFAMQWVLENLLAHLKQRGRRPTPFTVTIDEFANLAAQTAPAGRNPLSELFDEFIAQYCRNNRVFLSVALQSVQVLDEQLRNTLLRLGTIISGRAGTLDEARELANLLAKKDPFLIKHVRERWRQEELPSGRRQRVLVDWEPTAYVSLEEQQELYAQKIAGLKLFEFLIRPAVSEGTVSQEVISFSIGDALRDPATGQFQFPAPEDASLIAAMQEELAQRSGVPMYPAAPDAEQEERLALGTGKKEGTISGGSTPQESSLRDGAHPAPGKPKTTPSLPTLDQQERSLLAVISEHPDTPVATLYKSLGVSVWKGNEIRQRLKAKGLLLDVALRTGRPTAGRPATYTLLTFQAFQLLGIAPPTGRGGVLHRRVQSIIRDGAIAKGYTAIVEKALGNGGIVDVHLEKGQHRIAVEVAIASKAEREIAHIKHLLAVGYYDQIYTLFADDLLLSQTATLIRETLSAEEAGKVRLLPLSQLSAVG
jgi:hypothetical protein